MSTGYSNPDHALDVQAEHLAVAMHRAALARITASNRAPATECVDCSEPIPATRLVLVIGCQRCFGCQTKLESK